jgi:hypothetical protein
MGTSETRTSVANPFIQIFLIKERTYVISVPIATSLLNFCNNEGLTAPLHGGLILLKLNGEMLNLTDKILQDQDEITILSTGGKGGSEHKGESKDVKGSPTARNPSKLLQSTSFPDTVLD